MPITDGTVCQRKIPDIPELTKRAKLPIPQAPIFVEIRAALDLNYQNHILVTPPMEDRATDPDVRRVDAVKNRCHYCHQVIHDGIHPYTLRLELFPAIEPSLEITPDQLEIDFEAEFTRLIEVMQEMQDSDVVKQENLTFVSHTFTLCPDCRQRVANQLEILRPSLD